VHLYRNFSRRPRSAKLATCSGPFMRRRLNKAIIEDPRERGKNDVADAEAICEASRGQTMRFVAAKSAEAV
jgi:hypothetical protein